LRRLPVIKVRAAARKFRARDRLAHSLLGRPKNAKLFSPEAQSFKLKNTARVMNQASRAVSVCCCGENYVLGGACLFARIPVAAGDSFRRSRCDTAG
jgi:hypothetical protein